MSAISLSAVTKRFGDAAAVDGVSLEIAAGEFVALLGASGCGKTTLLRLIAGFDTLSSGAIRFDGTVMAGEGRHVPPEDRNVGIVFQSYALWPHMSVAENVGYPLRVRGIRGAAKADKVAEALAAVDLSGFEARRPADLSGGQRQRVALARCLAMDPAVVLLDEPLANLDVNLRASMEDTFKEFHERTKATMVYVTHDQAEAMAMADRVAVMEAGRVLQVTDPVTLYGEPASEAVARFVGNGSVVDCRVVGPAASGRAHVALFGHEADVRADPATLAPLGTTARLCLRPEHLTLSDGEGFAARVAKATFKGSHALLEVAPAAAPAQLLPVWAPRLVPTGTEVRIAIRDGWLLPGAAMRVPAARAA
ncbi:ATP-binding cassette domain-containing protein [Aurantimonas aggregata]|uniref:ATP-binding cassette domain-containing protein n=1 Tax=Aurantimonas aggregata TaxID=2047720 RepID=A0A6L9MDD5_9HYPH|nr:ABC transporter ATP-binding protein [Aurantimonas aggregata]NDV85681.1 ATP-binding cassette domain-containing protein [Aurantimonas aggregata]